MVSVAWSVCTKWTSVKGSNLADCRGIHLNASQPITVYPRERMQDIGQERNADDVSLIPPFPSTGVLHGVHGYEALPAVQHGQQSLLNHPAARGRALSTWPDVHFTSTTQIPNEHAGEGPNGHGRDAVSSAAGMSTNSTARTLAHVRPAMIHDLSHPPLQSPSRLNSRCYKRYCCGTFAFSW